MSPQKKTTAKSAARKVSKKVSGTASRKIPPKASPGSLKKTSQKPSPPENATRMTEDMIDTIGAGIYLLQKGKFVSASLTFEKLTGYKASDLMGKHFLDHVHPDDRKTVRGSQKKQNRDPYEYRFIRKDGEVIWFLETSGPIVHAKAKATLGSVMDITRYKLTEESIGLKEERYGTLLQEIEDNYFETDLKGCFTFVNDALVRHIGYSKEKLLGMNYRRYCDAATAEKMKELFNQVYSTGKPFSGFEAEFIIKDGLKRFAEVSGALIRDKQGKSIGFRGLSRDITERKQVEAALQQSDERFQALFDHSLDGVFIHDFEGNLLDFNQAALNNLGYDHDEIMSLNFAAMLTEEGIVQATQIVDELLKTGIQQKPAEFKFRCKDGSYIDGETVSSLICHDGKPYAVIGISRDTTERKKLEEDIRRSEERYRTILEDIDEGFCELDLKGVITFVNEAAAKLFGQSSKELIGKNYRQYVDPATADQYLDMFKSIYETGEPIKGFEVEFVNKDGLRRFVEISGALVRGANGKPAGFRGLTRDITQRKWADDTLLQSEAKYFSIIESIGDAYFETDLRGVTTFANDKVCADLGYTRDELLHMSHREIQTAENAQKTYEVFRRVYETGQPYKAYQYEIVRKDGLKAVFEMSVSLMRDSQGKPIGFRGLSRDITERKKMENALKASEERARTLIATIPDPYIERDLEGRAVYVNDAYVKLSGYSAEELRNMPYSDYLDARNAEIVSSTYQTVRQTGLMMKNIEVDIITKSGETRRVNLSASLVLDSQGNPTGFQSIIRDVTEIKKAQEFIRQSEQSLREYSETLESRVQERTTALEKAKLAAEAASRVKSDFLANISHEFQTPLNAIIGFTKVLKDRLFGDLNGKQEEFVRYISEAGENLSKLLNEIIDVSSVSTGKTQLTLSTVSIPQALSKTVTLLNAQIQDKQQILTVDVALDADVSIEADEEKVRHIFYHMLSNAVKYSPLGGKIIVDVQRTKSLTGEDGLAVAVADNGPGIKQEDIPRLFQDFGRLESAYTRESTGVGVGLTLTRQLVELHGGSISVESEYGSGSRFIVFLPLKQKRQVAQG